MRFRSAGLLLGSLLVSACAATAEDFDNVVGDAGRKDTGLKDAELVDTPADGAGDSAGDSAKTDTGTGPDTGLGPDTGTPTDTGTLDTGTLDTGTPDTGTPDTGTPDTGTPDTGTPDTGTPDTGTPDTGTPDTGPPDTGITASFIFPTSTDTAVILYDPYFWNLGDYYQGVRTTTLPSATSFSSTIGVTNSISSCGSLTVDVSLNGTKIGAVTFTAGVSAVPASFTFPAITGPTYTIRYRATKTVESGCGALTFNEGTSTVTLK